MKMYVCGRRRDFTNDYDETNADDIRVGIDNVLPWCYVSPDMTHVTQRGRGLCEFPESMDGDAIECCKRAKFPKRSIGDMYIRFGDLPEGGRSRNHATGEYEPGVSCYDASWDYEDGCWRICGGGLVGAIMAAAIKGVPAYLARGREVGRGSDGEPCIADATIVCGLDWDGKGRFFEVVA